MKTYDEMAAMVVSRRSRFFRENPGAEAAFQAGQEFNPEPAGASASGGTPPVIRGFDVRDILASETKATPPEPQRRPKQDKKKTKRRPKPNPRKRASKRGAKRAPVKKPARRKAARRR